MRLRELAVLMSCLTASSIADAGSLEREGNVLKRQECSHACRITPSGGIACRNFLVTDYDQYCVSYRWVSTPCGLRWKRVHYFCQ
jgi:hypothetical protein